MDVAHLLDRPEGKTLEYKRDLSSPDGVLRTVSAFANTAGGTILIGIEKDRSVRGLPDPLGDEERIANLISDAIRPQLVAEIEVVSCRDKSLLAVQIFPGPARPYHLAKSGIEQGSYVRVGSTNRRAGPEVLDELRRANTGQCFDEQPLPDLDGGAIDFEAAAEQFESVRKLRRSDLRTLGVTMQVGKREVPTIGGLLLFGVRRRDVFPDAVVDVARFAGTDRTELLDMQTIDDLLVPTIDRALAHAVQHTRERFKIEGARRESVGRVPERALREAIVNAVVHADYSQRGSHIKIATYADRVEVENPGLLPLGMTIEDLKAGHSKLRNRVLGRVLHELGLIEQWGTGVQKMFAACKRAGIAEPRFEEIGLQFRVTFPFAAAAALEPSDSDRQILDLLREAGNMSTAGIGEAVGRTTRAVRNQLNRLVETGLVVVVGTGPNDPQRRYRLAVRPNR